MFITVSIIIQYEQGEAETLAQNIRCTLGEEFINEARRMAPEAVIEMVTSVARFDTYSCYLEHPDTVVEARPYLTTGQKVYGQPPCR